MMVTTVIMMMIVMMMMTIVMMMMMIASILNRHIFYILPHFLEGARQDHSVASRMIYMRIFVCTCIISRICSGRMATEINTNSRHEQRYSSRNSFRKNILLPAGTMRRFNEYFPDERQPTLIRISTELWTGYNYRK